jgi:hypothetical protein
LAQQRIYQATEKPKTYRRAYGKTRRAENPERELARVIAWREANPERYAANQRAWEKENKVRINLAKRIINALKGNSKSASTMKLVGCDIDWLWAWLEIQFKPGMTRENYGPVWEVDHIRPCASFDLTDPQQQKLCFHWTNLQPLPPPENRRKNAKWDGEAA